MFNYTQAAWQFYMGCGGNPQRPTPFEINMEGTNLYMGVSIPSSHFLHEDWPVAHIMGGHWPCKAVVGRQADQIETVTDTNLGFCRVVTREALAGTSVQMSTGMEST